MRTRENAAGGTKRLAVIGGGGFAKELAEVAGLNDYVVDSTAAISTSC